MTLKIVRAVFVILMAVSAVIPSLAFPIVQRPLLCNGGICTRANVKAPAPIPHRREELDVRDPLGLGMRYVRDVPVPLSPSPSVVRRGMFVELEAREPIVIVHGMNPNIDTRLPWNRHGPRVLVLKREFAEELEAREAAD